MDPRSFTTISEQANKEWLSWALDIPVNESLGIDLLDDTTGIELKGRYAIISRDSTQKMPFFGCQKTLLSPPECR